MNAINEHISLDYYYFYFNLTMIKANDVHNNGIFKETILFAEYDDVFCPIKNLTKILIKKYDISDFLKLYAQYKDTKNIIIDSRLVECLIYGILLYDSDIVIYNVINNKCENIFTFCRNLFQINASSLNMYYIKKILFLYLFVNFYLKDINTVVWNNAFANKCANIYSYGEYITLDYIINYINISCTINDGKNINKITNIINDVINFKNLKHIKPFPKMYSIMEIQLVLKNLLMLNVAINI